MKTNKASGSRAALVPLSVLVPLAAGLVIADYISYRNYERHYRAEVEKQLSAIAELKVAQIVQWRRERLANATYFLHTPYAAGCALNVLNEPASNPNRQMFTAWLRAVLAEGPYEQAFLLDKRLDVGLVCPEGSSKVMGEAVRHAAQEALHSQQVVVADLHRETEDGPVYLSLIVPLVLRPESTGDKVPAAGKDSFPSDRSAGLLVLQINANKELYPMIQLWPTPSRTAETLLVRRDGNDALFLNELKFMTNTALKLRTPLASTNVPAVKAALGQEGIIEGIDYRGVPVVAALRAIPDSPWTMVARMDLAELYAPLRERLWLTVLLMAALLLSVGASVGLVWREQRLRFYRERAEAGDEARRMVTVVRDSNDAITIQDFTGRITAWNRGAALMYGYGEAEALQMNIEHLTAPGKVAEEKDFVRRLAAGEAVASLETQRVTKDGRILEVWLTVTKLMDDAGEPIGIASTERDITACKRGEAEIRQLNLTLEQRVHDRTAQLEAANNELETFSYSVSHDLRAPLRAIDGFARILEEDYTARLDDEGRRLLGTICGEAKRMGQLIDDLLAFSRMSRQQVDSTPIDMTALAQAVFEEHAAQATGRHLQFKAQPLPPAQGDPAMLRQALANLFSNAIKYTRPRAVAEIEMGGRAEGGDNLYYVKDNGVGFDMKYAGKLFGVFQRLHTEDEFEGTGVGLALVQRVIHRHGGRVWAEAKLDEGATFCFTIPLRKNGT
jgi:PAS domain S-box-containing protein